MKSLEPVISLSSQGHTEGHSETSVTTIATCSDSKLSKLPEIFCLISLQMQQERENLEDLLNIVENLFKHLFGP